MKIRLTALIICIITVFFALKLFVIGIKVNPLSKGVPDKFDLKVYGQTSIPINKESDNHQKLINWITKNENNWTVSLVSYTPKTIIKAQGFSYNFQNHRVILITTPPEFPLRQYVKSFKGAVKPPVDINNAFE